MAAREEAFVKISDVVTALCVAGIFLAVGIFSVSSDGRVVFDTTPRSLIIWGCCAAAVFFALLAINVVGGVIRRMIARRPKRTYRDY